MIRVAGLILCAIAVLVSSGVQGLAAAVGPEGPALPDLEAEIGIVIDADLGDVLFGQNMDAEAAPAGLNKLLTALIVAENCDLDENVTFSYDAVYCVDDSSGNSLGFEAGDTLSVKDCLYAMLMQSSNQAANALAEYMAGSREGFVEMMNNKAQELGCRQTHFTNPSGLDHKKQRTTARDMAIIAKAAYENQAVFAASSVQTYKLPATINNHEGMVISSRHRFLLNSEPGEETYYPAAKAGMVSFSAQAGMVLVTCAERGGRRLISVTLQDKERAIYRDAVRLLEFGFHK